MKRLKSIVKWIAIAVAALIAILLVLNALFVWSNGTALERKLLELRQAGDPVQLSDLPREPIPPEQNADVYLRRAADDLDAIQKELLALYPKTVVPTADVSAPEKEKLRKLFASYPRVMPLLEQAASCSDYDPEIDGSLPPSRFFGPGMERSTKHRLLARVLRARTALLVAEGRIDDAVANSVLMLRLTRHWRREPLLIGYLVTVACEQSAMDGVNQALQGGPVSPPTRQALDGELALHDTMEGLRWALRSERSFSLSSVREQILIGRTWLGRGLLNDLELRLIGLFDDYINQAQKPYSEVEASKRSEGIRRGGLNPFGPLVTLLEPSLVAAREPAERVRAMSRCLRVLNALQSRVATTSDQLPKLDDLGLPLETTIDPYNGEPLHLKKSPAGNMVYSVGKNLADDGGKMDGIADIGAGPRSKDEPVKKS
jgi:hypothetical protein